MPLLLNYYYYICTDYCHEHAAGAVAKVKSVRHEQKCLELVLESEK